MLTKPPARKSVNLSLSKDILAEARTLDINMSRAAEEGLAAAIRERKAQLWIEENRAAIESSNAYVEEHGLPLAKYRMF